MFLVRPCTVVVQLYSCHEGLTAGAHRLWSHRSYRAGLPLRIFLAFGHTMASQNSLFVWCRDHRVHHKFSDTDADPHNPTRGFFFAHVSYILIHSGIVLRSVRQTLQTDVYLHYCPPSIT